jgi:hypothetical protein
VPLKADENGRANSGRFAPGNKLGRGRPKLGFSLAEAVRSQADPKWVAKQLVDLALNGESESIRLQALQAIADRGWGKATQAHELEATISRGADEPTLNWDAVPLEDRRAALAAYRLALTGDSE